MSWRRLEIYKTKTGATLDLDTNCKIEGFLLSGSDNVILILTGPDIPWDGCPDIYHDAEDNPLPMEDLESP